VSELATIRAAIAAMHRAIPNVGVVHDYERFTRASEDKFRELYVFKAAGVAQQVRGWWWRRTGTEERTISTGTVVNVHTWECRGYMALNDAEASEKAFDELIEDFRAAVRADPSIAGTCEPDPNGPDGVQVLDAGPVSFCGVLCHSAVLQLKTWSYL
jgi:hypothetical protein